ncbi:MAG: peroxiredoxin family protein [Gemmatimonadetes bacterium]|nr:peroxiredoxin family protein [Gemmatimonadota bacterium]
MKRLNGALVLVALAQLALLSSGMMRKEAPRPPRPDPVRVGDQVGELPGHMDGAPARVALRRSDQRWTAVLAFASDCVHCETVAPDWSNWLRKEHAFEVIGISRDAPQDAAAYRGHHGWRMRILNVPRGDARTGFLVSRTPWVFLFDDRGVLRYEGHGRSVASVDSIVRAGRLTPPGIKTTPPPQQGE